jgi:hypothetical protein
VAPGQGLMRSGHRFLVATAIAITCYAFIFTHLKPQALAAYRPYSNSDFSCFYRAGRMVLAGQGGRIYDLEASRSFDAKLRAAVVRPDQGFLTMAFLFPPFTLLFYAPLAALSYHAAELVCDVLNAAALMLCPLILWIKGMLRERQAALWLVASVFFYPVILSLLRGQPVPWILLFLTLTFVAFQEARDIAAGCLLALASIKPQFILPVVLTIFIARRWRTVIGFVGAEILLTASSIPLVGWRGTENFLRAISGDVLEFPSLSPTIRGLIYNLLRSRLSDGQLKNATVAVSVLLITACALYLAHHQPTTAAGFSLAITVGLLASVHAGLHDLLLLILVGMLFAQLLHQKTMLTAALAFTLMIPVIAHGQTKATAVLTCCSLAVLASVIVLATKTNKKPITPDKTSLPRVGPA